MMMMVSIIMTIIDNIVIMVDTVRRRYSQGSYQYRVR